MMIVRPWVNEYYNNVSDKRLEHALVFRFEIHGKLVN